MATHLQGIIPFVVYNTKDSTAPHYTDVHKGNEAAAYLQFIVDYYECLPEVMAFIHAHRRDMKVAPDFDMVSTHLLCVYMHVYMAAHVTHCTTHQHCACLTTWWGNLQHLQVANACLAMQVHIGFKNCRAVVRCAWQRMTHQ